MARFQDTPDLFGRGVGSSTGFSIKCDFCGTVHNGDTDPDDPRTEGDSICHTYFAGLQVGECCFEKIENEILRRMKDILPWYARILRSRRQQLEKNEDYLADVRKALAKEARTYGG